MTKSKFTIDEITEHVAYVQSFDPENEYYAGVLDSLSDGVVTEQIIRDIQTNPWSYVPSYILVELQDLHGKGSFYIDVEGTSIPICIKKSS